MTRVVLALVTALLAAPAAQAATVSRSTETFDAQGGDKVVVHTVTVEAAPGEANAMTVTGRPGELVVAEAATAVIAGAGCEGAGGTTVRCPTPRRGDVTRAEVVVRLGDGDDALTVTRVAGALPLLPTVECGDGADTITSGGIVEGGPGDDRLTGTAGDEGMSGGAGDDVLRGLGGDDDLLGDTEPQDGSRSGPEGNDVIDGGSGTDSVLYLARTRPVTIDLGTGTAGSAGEQDTLIGIEDATGGAGADTITGTDGPNQLNGFGGRDVIRALGGDDLVEGGTDVDAGTGDDRVVFPRGGYDCGPGTDIVAATPRRVPVPDGCELVELDQSLTLEARPRVGAGLRVRLRSTCRCRYRGRLVVSAGGKVLARGRVDVPPTRTVPIRATFTLALTRAGARAARPGTEVTVTFTSRQVTTPPFRTRLVGR